MLKKTYLSDPVRVQYAHVGVHSTDTLLSSGSKRSLELELSNTLVLGLSVNDTLGVGSLTSSTSNSASHDRHTRNTLVSETSRFLGTTRTSKLLDVRLHTSLPHTNTGKESKNIGALLLLQFSQVGVGGRHLCL